MSGTKRQKWAADDPSVSVMIPGWTNCALDTLISATANDNYHGGASFCALITYQ